MARLSASRAFRRHTRDHQVLATLDRKYKLFTYRHQKSVIAAQKRLVSQWDSRTSWHPCLVVVVYLLETFPLSACQPLFRKAPTVMTSLWLEIPQPREFQLLSIETFFSEFRLVTSLVTSRATVNEFWAANRWFSLLKKSVRLCWDPIIVVGCVRALCRTLSRQSKGKKTFSHFPSSQQRGHKVPPELSQKLN